MATSQLPCTLACSAVATMAVALLFLCSSASSRPTYQIIDGVEVVWEKPPNAHSVLFLAHGCLHKAVDWWKRSEDCPLCAGTIHELNISRRVLARGYAIVAVSPIGKRDWGCWQDQDEKNVLQPSDDMKRVVNSLHHVMKDQGMEGLPLYAYGASAGAYMVMTLPFYMNVTGIAPSIATISTWLLERMLDGTRKKDPNFKYPPAAFIYMPRDPIFSVAIPPMITKLRQLGVKTVEWTLHPHPLDAKSMALTAQIPVAHAEKIMKMMRKEGYLDGDDMLVENPWGFNYRGLMDSDPELFYIPRAPSMSGMWVYLSVAYANHELSSIYVEDLMDWWESMRKPPSDM